MEELLNNSRFQSTIPLISGFIQIFVSPSLQNAFIKQNKIRWIYYQKLSTPSFPNSISPMSMTMNSYHKYKNSPVEIFKLRMQLKAEINDLRKTYQAVVSEKPLSKTPNKKHFTEFLYTPTTLAPQSKTPKPLRKSVSPSPKLDKNERTSYSGKKQFSNIKNTSNLSEVMKFTQKRKKSVSPAFYDRTPGRITQTPKDRMKRLLGTCERQKSPDSAMKTSKKILPQYHRFNKDFLVG